MNLLINTDTDIMYLILVVVAIVVLRKLKIVSRLIKLIIIAIILFAIYNFIR